MRLGELVATSVAVGATRSRRDKTARLADLLRRLTPAEAPIAVAYLTGTLPQGRIGVGYATLGEIAPPPAATSTLTLTEVNVTCQRVADTAGAGSQRTIGELLHDLLARATAEEQRFLRGLLLHELRQGALEGVMLEAVAAAVEVPAAALRRAVMLAGDLPAVATAVLADGPAALARFRLTLGQPLKPMLASTAASTTDALDALGGAAAAIEYKLDGARIQVHRDGDEVRIFTRSLREVTGDLPAVVGAVRGLPARRLVLDGEALALDAGGRPLAFQDTMRVFGSGDAPADGTLRPFFFDCLHRDGEDLLDAPARDRVAVLLDTLPDDLLVPRRVVTGVADADALLEEALRAGHEGVMVKDLDAPYEAGRRGSSWLKVKPVHTLDLVVLAAEWGSGRRRGWLSNLHLGAREDDGGFVMLGKTFKGLTDELLTWQTEQLLARETRREGHVVHVRPELVVEIAFDGVQSSPRYPGGLALRFARVRGYRPDKTPAEADTIDTVRAIHAGERLPRQE